MGTAHLLDIAWTWDRFALIVRVAPSYLTFLFFP